MSWLLSCYSCAHKDVKGFVFVNHTGKSVELLHSMTNKEITDKYIYQYSRPYYLNSIGTKMSNYRTIIRSQSRCYIDMPDNWMDIIRKEFFNKLPITILFTDSINSIVTDSFPSKGIKSKCVVEYLEIEMDTLEINNYEIHYYGKR